MGSNGRFPKPKITIDTFFTKRLKLYVGRPCYLFQVEKAIIECVSFLDALASLAFKLSETKGSPCTRKALFKQNSSK